MEPKKDQMGVKPLLSNLLTQVGKEQPNYGQLGEALLDMSKAIVDGAGDTKEVDRLREKWNRQTRNGTVLGGNIDGDVRLFQNSIQEIAELKESYDSYVFYVPGSSGIIRVGIAIGKDSRPKAYLADSGSNIKAKENFEKLF